MAPRHVVHPLEVEVMGPLEDLGRPWKPAFLYTNRFLFCPVPLFIGSSLAGLDTLGRNLP